MRDLAELWEGAGRPTVCWRWRACVWPAGSSWSTACRRVAGLVLTGAAWLTVFAMFLTRICAGLDRHSRPPADAQLLVRTVPARPYWPCSRARFLAQLSSIFLVKESIERLLEGNEHSHSHSLFIPGTIAS